LLNLFGKPRVGLVYTYVDAPVIWSLGEFKS
jgi:hypothetical protein